MTKGGEKGLWDLAIDKVHTEEEEQKAAEESAVFLVGSKNSGKTSMILRFLERDEPPKPSVALEYTFGRRARGHNLAKDVGHIWELGGGTWLSKLINVPVNADNLMNLSVILVLDLSSPNELWFTLETFLKELRQYIDAAITAARRDDPNIKNKLKEKTWERIGADHADKDLMDPFLIPLVLIGGKYDIFQDFDSEKRKVMCKTLRFVAHSQGAHLQFFSTKQDALMTRARALITHLLFGTSGSKNVQVDHNKPLLVPAGQDSLQSIGSPPIADGDLGRLSAKSPMDLWKATYLSFFPQENISNPSQVEDPAKDAQYKEHAVDSCRMQKDEELERYKKLAERRAKEVERQLND